MMMNKREMLMAQKTIQAKQVKREEKLIKGYLEATRTNRSDIPNISSHDLLQHHQSMNSLPELKSSSEVNTYGKDTLFSPSKPALSEANNNLVSELAQRATTAKTGLRLMNTNVAKSLSKLPPASPNGNSDTMQRPSTAQNLNSDNYFMPKVSIPRPDGATLTDIYESKKQDTWGRILKAQIKEDEEQKKIKKQLKYKSDEEYGKLIKKQIQDNINIIANSNKQDTLFAKLEDSTAKRTEDLQKGRVEDAIRRHKQFISNAVEDIHIKKVRKEAEMYEDCMASSVMINKAKQLIAEEEAKKIADKEYHKQYQERLFQENLESIERKQKERLKTFAEDKKIIEDAERQFLKEQKRREDALAKKIQRTSEGPAHHVVQALIDEKKRRENEFYNSLCSTENVLNKQLRTSEEAGAARNKSNGDVLTREFELRKKYLANKKREDDENNEKIIREMKEILAREEREDKAKKERARELALKYQHDLDSQLSTLRQKSQDALKKTMSEQEIKYNSNLIKKAAVKVQ